MCNTLQKAKRLQNLGRQYTQLNSMNKIYHCFKIQSCVIQAGSSGLSSKSIYTNTIHIVAKERSRDAGKRKIETTCTIAKHPYIQSLTIHIAKFL